MSKYSRNFKQIPSNDRIPMTPVSKPYSLS